MSPIPVRPHAALHASPAAQRVAVRLHDYLTELDAPLSTLAPLVDLLPHSVGDRAVERARVALLLVWGASVAHPAAAIHLNLTIDSPVSLLAAGRDVRREFRLASHVATLDTAHADDMAAAYVFNGLFLAFTWPGRPLSRAALPVLQSGLVLLDHLLSINALTHPSELDARRQHWQTPRMGGAHA